MPIEMDADVAAQYDRTLDRLKTYMKDIRYEKGGSASFRGAYLQWGLGWPNAPHIDARIIHNRRDPLTRRVKAHRVAEVPAMPADRLYAKENALVALVRTELAATRPVIVYCRQTDTKDIQPRIKALLETHIEEARCYILSSKIDTGRREEVLTKAIQSGINVLITNPELIKTGLDLIEFKTIIWFEIILNLSTMLQASSRHYRANQDPNTPCRVYYLFYQKTMEHLMVELMSRKQRAAKLLAGETGLTGLDALTEDEGKVEQMLIDALQSNQHMPDVQALFNQEAEPASIIDQADSAFWNSNSPAAATPALPALQPVTVTPHHDLAHLVRDYLRTAHHSNGKTDALTGKLLGIVLDGAVDPVEDTRILVGLTDPDYPTCPVHRAKMLRWLAGWLKKQKLVQPEAVDSAAAYILNLAEHRLGLRQQSPDLLEQLKHSKGRADTDHGLLRLLETGMELGATSAIVREEAPDETAADRRASIARYLQMVALRSQPEQVETALTLAEQHQGQALRAALRQWLRHVVFPGCEAEVAEQLLELLGKPVRPATQRSEKKHTRERQPAEPAPPPLTLW